MTVPPRLVKNSSPPLGAFSPITPASAGRARRNKQSSRRCCRLALLFGAAWTSEDIGAKRQKNRTAIRNCFWISFRRMGENCGATSADGSSKEQTHGLEKCRRLLVCHEHLLTTYRAFIFLACPGSPCANVYETRSSLASKNCDDCCSGNAIRNVAKMPWPDTSP